MEKKVDFSLYRTAVFDCDGVILDSNKVKTDAFRQATLPYGTEAAEAMVAYHMANGGISRYAKFSYFLENIVPGALGPELNTLLTKYAEAVREGLMRCNVAPRLAELRSAYPDQRWMIVSGGDQAELRTLFSARGIATFFDGGIFGSPDTKDEILAREVAAENISAPALFLGDSTYDHRAAHGAGLDFVFVSGWSEVANWSDYVAKHDLISISAIAGLKM